MSQEAEQQVAAIGWDGPSNRVEAPLEANRPQTPPSPQRPRAFLASSNDNIHLANIRHDRAEAARLWSTYYQGRRGSGDPFFALVDPDRRGEYGIRVYDGEARETRTQTALRVVYSFFVGPFVRRRGRDANRQRDDEEDDSPPAEPRFVLRPERLDNRNEEALIARLSAELHRDTHWPFTRRRLARRPSNGRMFLQRICPCVARQRNRSRDSYDNMRMQSPIIAEDAAVRPEVTRTVEYGSYFLKDMFKVLNSPYYWGSIDRFRAEEMLEGKPEGTFLLRDSAQNAYLFSVSFRRYQRTLHARIEQHRFGFDIHDSGVYSSTSVTRLIEHYGDPAKCLFFEPLLTTPLRRNFVFSLQELCRSVITSHIPYSEVNQLPLPPKLKEYLREFHYIHPLRTIVYD